jgi:hypothetical protein
MKRLLVFSLFLALFISGVAVAQPKPDFSGTWVLDPAKSDMGMARTGAAAPAARTVTLVIKQTAAQLSVERHVGDRAETAVFKLDGSESVNKAPSGSDIKSTTKWVGTTLVTKSMMMVGEANVESNDVRSLSADGKVMTIDVTRQTPRGEVKQKLLYNKQ